MRTSSSVVAVTPLRYISSAAALTILARVAASRGRRRAWAGESLRKTATIIDPYVTCVFGRYLVLEDPVAAT